MKNKNTVNEYYDEVIKAAKVMEQYWEKMAKFTKYPESAKEFNYFRLEARNTWRALASYEEKITG